MDAGSSRRTGYYVDHKMIGLPRQGIKHLESLLDLADWRVVVQNLSFLSTVESQSRMFGGKSLDDTVARQFIDTTQSAQVLHELGQGGFLISKFGLAIIAMTAIRLGKEKEGHGRFPSHQTLGEILLTANDIATEESGDDPSSTQALAALVSHLGVSSGETPFCRIARYYQLLVEIPQRMPRDAAWRDLSALFNQNMGFEIKRLFAIAFGLYSVYGELGSELNDRWRGKDLPIPEPGRWVLDSRTFLKNTALTPASAHQ